MNLVLVGLSHKTAEVEVRERLAFSEKEMEDYLFRLKSYPEIKECIIISTCNRVEISAAVRNTSAAVETITAFLVEKSGLQHDRIVPHLYFHTGTDAILHIFKVASSIDSLVIGESQILGQLKDAFETALHHKATGVVLNKIYKKAISVAKRVRTETAISENAVSISSVAVELAEKIFGTLNEKTLMVVGAGEMAELALKHMLANGPEDIIITNRSYENAVALAEAYNGRAVPFDKFHEYMESADIIICSTGAPHYVIKADEVENVLEKRKNRSMFFIDISVPRNIDPNINKIDNVFLYDVDDLQKVVSENLNERQLEAGHAMEIIENEVSTTASWLKSLEAVPTIVAIKEKGEEIRKAEIEKLLQKMNNLSEKEKAAIEAFSESIINKLLHAPVVVLKQEVDSPNGTQYLEAARRLFNLDKNVTSHYHQKKMEKEEKRSIG